MKCCKKCYSALRKSYKKDAELVSIDECEVNFACGLVEIDLLL